ncbi:MAG: AAA family ATPase [Deltaproteobacteria bacterium]|nr:AAA family ATPase [Deltaproteobacteria bacterium]
MFVGRERELKLLEDAYRTGKDELVVLYGRRRIGKSSLVKHFARGKRSFYHFEALEGETTKRQIEHFSQQLKEMVDDPILDSVRFENWEQVFTYLAEKIFKRKTRTKKILFLDELPWMAASRSRLVSLLKYYWDNHWKGKNIMLILCGSVASFMVKKVLHSNALYGRTTLEMLLKGLHPDETADLLRKRSREEVLNYQLVFGGVPKYLEQINPDLSFNQNMNKMCFSPHGVMLNEVERIFYSQFREPRTYGKIISLLKKGLLSTGEISSKTKIPSGGGLKQYLDNLERADMIRSFVPFDRSPNSKFKKYTLADEFLVFYFKYIEPNRQTIKESSSLKLFETLTQNSFDIWLGYAFERFCLKHAGMLASIMGFADDLLLASPHFEKNDQGFQIDLLYKRADRVITVCEIKYHNKKIGTHIIPEMERKCALVKVPRGYTLEKALISLYGPDKALKDAGYFHHFVTLDDILNPA